MGPGPKPKMVAVDVVLAARVFVNLFVGLSGDPGSGVGERAGVELRVFDQRFDVDVVGVGAGPALDDVQGVAMRAAVFVGPDLRVFEADGIDHQRVAFPMAEFLAEERRVGIFGVLARGVDGDQAIVAVPVEKRYFLRRRARSRRAVRWRCGAGCRR